MVPDALCTRFVQLPVKFRMKSAGNASRVSIHVKKNSFCTCTYAHLSTMKIGRQSKPSLKSSHQLPLRLNIYPNQIKQRSILKKLVRLRALTSSPGAVSTAPQTQDQKPKDISVPRENARDQATRKRRQRHTKTGHEADRIELIANSFVAGSKSLGCRFSWCCLCF